MKKPADKAAENAELKARLAEVGELVSAIRSGAVDAIVTDDERVFILQGADHAYRVLVEAISEGAATLTFDGTLMYCNGRLADMLGLSAERIIGGSFLDLVGPDELPGLQALLRRGRSNAARAEFRLRKGDGTLLPVLVSCNPLKIEHLGLCLVVTDLTEQKKAWAELAAERAHLEELVPSAPPN
jgi:PAS domain S-box-containing protein